MPAEALTEEALLNLVPDPDAIRPHLEQAERRADLLRRLLRIALDRQVTPEQLARLRAHNRGRRHAAD